jgi:hypothetical protein
MRLPRTDAAPPHVELELILLGARTRLDEAARERLRVLAGTTLDWKEVVGESARHETLLLLHHHLSAHASDVVPPPVLERLARRARGEIFRILLLSGHLERIVRGLGELGVSPIVMKGPAVGAALYPEAELRTFGDLDLVVTPDEADDAMGFLKASGFLARYDLSGSRERMFRRTHPAMPFHHPRDGAWVDLHWGLARRVLGVPLPAEALQSETEVVQVRGTAVRVLRPGFLLITLCIHGTKHGPFPWPRLKWISDIDGFLHTHPDLDWDGVLEQARAIGSERMVLLGLELARTLLGSPVPSKLAPSLDADPTLKSWVDDIGTRLFDRSEEGFSLQERVVFDLWIRDRYRDKARYLLRRVLTPGERDWEPIGLPRGLTFLYVPMRLVRLAGAYLAEPGRVRNLMRGRSRGKRPGDPPAPVADPDG